MVANIQWGDRTLTCEVNKCRYLVMYRSFYTANRSCVDENKIREGEREEQKERRKWRVFTWTALRQAYQGHFFLSMEQWANEAEKPYAKRSEGQREWTREREERWFTKRKSLCFLGVLSESFRFSFFSDCIQNRWYRLSRPWSIKISTRRRRERG